MRHNKSMNPYHYIFLIFLILPGLAADEGDLGYFSGRVDHIRPEASLVRIYTTFDNLKYVNKKDKVEFWDERNTKSKCKGYVLGKSNEYLLLKVPQYKYCKRYVLLTPGAYLHFYGPDLVNNIKMGQEVLKILIKKRMAVQSRHLRRKKELDSHIEKVNSINMRFKVLRDKLESQWRKQLALVEEDRVTSLRNFKELELRISDIDKKIEQYRIADENMVEDRWALDPRLYFKK